MAEVPNIKPNSNKYREKTNLEDKHRVTKVTKGAVKKKQTSAMQKFAQAFVPEDAKSVKDYVVEEAPGFIISFMRRLLQNLLDTYLPENGKYFSGRSSAFRSTNTTFRYDTIRAGSSSSETAKARTSNNVYEYENVTFENYGDAEEVLDGLYDCLQRYEKVRVFDLYDLAGISTNAADINYGWVDLRGSRIISTREGWVIDLPKAIPLT